MNPVPAFPSVADAMAAVHAGLRFVADADATRLSAQAQAECLRMMEQADAIVTAARASVMSGFTAGKGYSADADYSVRAWLIHKDPDHQGSRGRAHRLGAPDGYPPAGGRGPGGRGAVGVVRADDLLLDRQAPRR